MKQDETRSGVIDSLLEKADMALKAARRELDAGDTGLATNRIYYACFYALSAVLLNEKQQFIKHTGTRAALHQHLVRTGRLSTDMGKFYDRAFAERHEADYNASSNFDPAMVGQRLADAEQFVGEMKRLLTA